MSVGIGTPEQRFDAIARMLAAIESAPLSTRVPLTLAAVREAAEEAEVANGRERADTPWTPPVGLRAAKVRLGVLARLLAAIEAEPDLVRRVDWTRATLAAARREEPCACADEPPRDYDANGEPVEVVGMFGGGEHRIIDGRKGRDDDNDLE